MTEQERQDKLEPYQTQLLDILEHDYHTQDQWVAKPTCKCDRCLAPYHYAIFLRQLKYLVAIGELYAIFPLESRRVPLFHIASMLEHLSDVIIDCYTDDVQMELLNAAAISYQRDILLHLHIPEKRHAFLEYTYVDDSWLPDERVQEWIEWNDKTDKSIYCRRR
jgi:hypothetical protein